MKKAAICDYSNKGKTPYISAKELSERWQCTLSSVDQITRQEGFKRFYLGEGKNGIVRFLKKEVEAYEASTLF